MTSEEQIKCTFEKWGLLVRRVYSYSDESGCCRSAASRDDGVGGAEKAMAWKLWRLRKREWKSERYHFLFGGLIGNSVFLASKKSKINEIKKMR